MKTYVIILSKHFPAGHRCAGKETCFAESIANGIKIHTIRDNYDLWEKRVTEVFCGRAQISIRQWEGKPYRSKQVEIMRLTSKDRIGIEKAKVSHSLLSGNLNIYVYDFQKCEWIVLPRHTVAENDGLHIDNFEGWFSDESVMSYAGETPHPLAIIHFTEFRYL